MFYDYLETDWVGRLTLVADAEGLRHIDFPNDRYPVAFDPQWKRDPAFFREVKIQLQEYFSGRRRRFDLPLAPLGTPFQQSVWRVLQQIPYGTVTSYQWVAAQIDNPRAVRAVGGANARNPLPIVIPCHRVIGRNGQLTGFGGGLAVKERLIALEKRFT
jgi:methylated-DNA-[protein]-cysteine S-methyltransferase